MAELDLIPDPHLHHLFDGEPVLNVYKSEVTNLSAGTPGPDLLKNCLEMFRQATKDRMEKEEDQAFLFQYGITSGLWEFREELAKYLTLKYGEKVHRQSLILTCGATHGIQIILTTIVQPNAVIFVEEATYMIALTQFRQYTGMKIISVPIDSEGVDVTALQRIVENERSRGAWKKTDEKPFWAIFYTIPIFHNPTGITVSKARCEALITVARSLDVLVVCDDVYNLLHYREGERPPRRLFAYDALLDGYAGGHVISNGSFSKILAPGVRIGWLEAPARLAKLFRESGYLKSGGGVNQYMAGLVTSLLEMGLQDKMLNTLIQTFKERMNAVCRVLEKSLPSSCSFIKPDGGYFIWITAPQSTDMDIFVPWCQRKYKISAIPGSKFSLLGECKNCLRLAIAFHSNETLTNATEKLCFALQEFISCGDMQYQITEK